MNREKEFLSELKKICGSSGVLTGIDLETRYAHIWEMDRGLRAAALVAPRSTQELSEIMKVCHRFSQRVVIHGGLTNLVGATRSDQGDLVISTENLDQIFEVDEISRTATVGAGVILENLQAAAEEKGLFFPLNFGARGSARMGGVISTNAGGLRVFRFGMTRSLILGLEVVLADGTIIDSRKKIIKDNAAYDIKQMFIGSEGTLGVITSAVVKLIEKPVSRNSAFAAVNDYSMLVRFLKFMDKNLGGSMSGFELIWNATYRQMTGPGSMIKPPLPSDYKYYVLVETMGTHQEKDRLALQVLLERCLEEEIILDGAMAFTESDLEWFWRIREDVHVLASACKHDQHFDISLPVPLIGPYVDKIIPILKNIPGVSKVFTFGHIADGNIHFIVDKENPSDRLRKEIDQTIYAPLGSLGGSVSAEHGIGIDKKDYLSLCRTKEEIALMRKLKSLMDPLNILNPGRVLEM